MQKLHILCRSFVLSHNNGLNNGNGFGCSLTTKLVHWDRPKLSQNLAFPQRIFTSAEAIHVGTPLRPVT